MCNILLHMMHHGERKQIPNKLTAPKQESFSKFKEIFTDECFNFFPHLTMQNQREKNVYHNTTGFLFIHVCIKHWNRPLWSKLHRSLHYSFATSLGSVEKGTASFEQSLNVSKHKLNRTYLSKACMVPHVTFELLQDKCLPKNKLVTNLTDTKESLRVYLLSWNAARYFRPFHCHRMM